MQNCSVLCGRLVHFFSPRKQVSSNVCPVCVAKAVESELPTKIVIQIQCLPASFSCYFKSNSDEFTGKVPMDRTQRDSSHFRVLTCIIFQLSSIAVYLDVSRKKHVLNFSSEKCFGLVDTEQRGLEEDRSGKQIVESLEVSLLYYQSRLLSVAPVHYVINFMEQNFFSEGTSSSTSE